jgi:aminocarboxymuconate-semialdehyde decarboxylase
MIIDCHAHLMPQSWFHPKSPKSIFDLDGLFKEQDTAGVDVTVFGNNWIRSPDGADALRVVKDFNEHAAELTAKHPKRLIGLACSVPFDDDQILKETERAIKEYKLRGIMINSSVNAEYLDSPRASAFFQLVSDMDVPVFVHPPKFTIGNEKMEIFRLPEMLGRPFDTTLSLTRFIFTGGFERFPKLKLVCAHVGGALPMLPGRYAFGYELRKDMSFGPWEPDVMTRKLHCAALSRHSVPPPPGSAMRDRHRRHRSRSVRQRLSAGAHSSQTLCRCGASIEDFK